MEQERRSKNHYKRNRFRSNGDRHFKKRNGESKKFNSDFPSNVNFQRKSPGRNNHNAPKLIEKYNDLAREALSNGDKILSENYLQAKIYLENGEKNILHNCFNN